jgi:hypothetical protein
MTTSTWTLYLLSDRLEQMPRNNLPCANQLVDKIQTEVDRRARLGQANSNVTIGIGRQWTGRALHPREVAVACHADRVEDGRHLEVYIDERLDKTFWESIMC